MVPSISATCFDVSNDLMFRNITGRFGICQYSKWSKFSPYVAYISVTYRMLDSSPLDTSRNGRFGLGVWCRVINQHSWLDLALAVAVGVVAGAVGAVMLLAVLGQTL